MNRYLESWYMVLPYSFLRKCGRAEYLLLQAENKTYKQNAKRTNENKMEMTGRTLV